MRVLPLLLCGVALWPAGSWAQPPEAPALDEEAQAEAPPGDAPAETAEPEPAALDEAPPEAQAEAPPEDLPAATAEPEAPGDAPPSAPMTVTPIPDEEEGIRLGVGFRLGATHQPYQWMTGFHLSIRNIAARFIETEASLVAGIAAEHYTLRAALHGKTVLRLGDFYAHFLVGPAAFVYLPRGAFAEWCDKLDLQECGGSAFGVEAGVGVGYRAFGIDAYLATGELPLATIVGTATWMF